jgi:fatty acid/phospholipid biosynthesis enzyme
MKRDLSADKNGGVTLLGGNGVGVKSDGSRSAEAVAHTLRQTFKLSKQGMNTF